MLIGDPSKFAIAWNIVKEWSTPTFNNGTLNIYVNFTLLGNRRNIVHEVGSNLFELSQLASRHEMQQVVEENILAKSDAEIFSFLNRYTFPTDDDGLPQGREFLAVPFGVYDDGYVMFCIKSGDVDQLYYGADDNFMGAISLPKNQYGSIVRDAWSVFQNEKLGVQD